MMSSSRAYCVCGGNRPHGEPPPFGNACYAITGYPQEYDTPDFKVSQILASELLWEL